MIAHASLYKNGAREGHSRGRQKSVGYIMRKLACLAAAAALSACASANAPAEKTASGTTLFLVGEQSTVRQPAAASEAQSPEPAQGSRLMHVYWFLAGR